MKKETGLIHVYCGNGKGKTTCGMGLCTRAAGYGYKVLIYQFMKDNSTSERKVLSLCPNVTIVDGLEDEKFSFQMTEEEKTQRRNFYQAQFHKLMKKAADESYDLIFLDELIYTIKANLFDEAVLIKALKEKPKNLEVILTGRNPSPALIEIADYVSEIQKIKHPFDCGQASRKGIEK